MFYQFYNFSSQVIHSVRHFHFRGLRNIWLLQCESKKFTYEVFWGHFPTAACFTCQLCVV